jgi:3-oxoacyl-[acyl-carrier protein] reductase
VVAEKKTSEAGLHVYSLQQKVALITGGANGIGEGIAHLFAEAGARVFILDIDAARAAATASAIRAKGLVAHWFESDVRQPASIAPAVESAIAQFGRLDILINNAGIYPRTPFLQMTEAQWDHIQDVNLKGIFHCTKLVLPHMIARGAGKIVNISSVTFHLGMKNLTHYIASKGGVIGFTRALAREVGDHKIHVNCITPGAVEVEAEKALTNPQDLAEILAAQCLKRRILPIDIARVCLFLSSELSDGMTGQTLNVDGGWIMY